MDNTVGTQHLFYGVLEAASFSIHKVNKKVLGP
jgi:hypothetical protein